MQTIHLEQEFACAASTVWEIVSDVSRSDWVPMGEARSAKPAKSAAF